MPRQLFSNKGQPKSLGVRQSLDQTQGSISKLPSRNICLILFCPLPTRHLTFELPYSLDLGTSACFGFLHAGLSCSPSLPNFFFVSFYLWYPSPFLSAQHFSAWNLRAGLRDCWRPWNCSCIEAEMHACERSLNFPWYSVSDTPGPSLLMSMYQGASNVIFFPTHVLRGGQPHAIWSIT